MGQAQLGLFDHLTHKANLKHTRYGWLRLTPAYSVHLVNDILKATVNSNPIVLDPFCGTGTTALVCAEKGIQADTTDINEFLLWLTTTKTQPYGDNDLVEFKSASEAIIEAVRQRPIQSPWIPGLHQIEKWWDHDVLLVLGQLMYYLHDFEGAYSPKVLDMLKIVFCRVLITHSNASFNHQSMSFKKQSNDSLFENATANVHITWQAAAADICRAAQSQVITPPRAVCCDARNLSGLLNHDYYTCVVTSPPYPNRMSYIRELRPYMYWLGYLADGREAGELDWKAIGGTWGIATSHAGKWVPPAARSIPYDRFAEIVTKIGERSDVLARYVHKYFYDMVDHVNELFVVAKSGASIHYVVGNSKFYDILLPVEEVFAAIFKAANFINVEIRPIRKRTSKKELFEYVVSANKP